ncbi:nucleoside-diphosphate sugar epimerase/dehydratase [Afifella pfennigii]|uniref:nucleoside-diphosphate sugar epimerase/dehydratase n=1 Tax=Afifella pfennigii TaxID=209897 RepID=UPI00068F00FA|nr:nucleoside-diphosphate sugar epimerase/dehydratase [Afifella pfennigii]
MMDQVVKRISRPMRHWIIYAYDFTAAASSLYLSYYLRLGTDSDYSTEQVPLLVGVFTLICIAVFPFFRLHSASWRYASVREIYSIAKAVTVAVLIFLVAVFLIQRTGSLPRSVLVIEWFVLIVMLGAPRMAYRLYRDGRQGRTTSDPSRPVEPILLYGFSNEADVFIRSVSRDRDSRFLVMAIIESNPKHIGRQLHGVPVAALVEELPEYVKQFASSPRPPSRIVTTRARMSPEVLQALVDAASQAGLVVNRLPDIQELEAGGASQPEAVRLEHLLGRPPIQLDEAGINRLIAGRSVLITGAGGSVGSEIVHQVARFGASRIILLENSEHNLYEIDRRLRRTAGPHVQICPVLCDIRDRETLLGAFQHFRPELVFHAAALKHVPILESNPSEAILSNVFGTQNVADAACECGVSAFIMISTDKAANPHNVLGLTKALAERYCQLLDREQAKTRLMIVRFGNVLGSRGSVVPLFEEQLRTGGPLTVTHPEATRYFMTSSEAAQLVLQASAYGFGSRIGGQILLLDMGQPVRIADLARNLIRLSGKRPDEDIHVAFTGLRPGEKLHEDLVGAHESVLETPAAGILAASAPPVDGAALRELFARLQAAARHGADDACTALLRNCFAAMHAQSAASNVRPLHERAPH